MTRNKLKEWRGIVDRRLSALESLFTNRGSKPQDTGNKSGLANPKEPAPQEQTYSKGTRAIKTLKWAGRLLAWFGFSLGVVTGYLALVPKVTVTQTEPLNPVDPFSAQFIVSNDGPLGIEDLSVVCVISNVRYKDMQARVSNNRINGNKGTELFKQRMDVGERASFTCPFSEVFHTRAPVIDAEIVTQLTFSPKFTWHHPHREYRFNTKSDATGLLHWYPQAVEPK